MLYIIFRNIRLKVEASKCTICLSYANSRLICYWKCMHNSEGKHRVQKFTKQKNKVAICQLSPAPRWSELYFSWPHDYFFVGRRVLSQWAFNTCIDFNELMRYLLHIHIVNGNSIKKVICATNTWWLIPCCWCCCFSQLPLKIYFLKNNKMNMIQLPVIFCPQTSRLKVDFMP